MLAGFRPELQPLPKPVPAPAKAASVAAVPVPPQVPGGNPNCEHKNVTKKGSNKHVEMETCRDCNMILRKVRRDTTAVQGQLPGPNTAQQDACPHPRISMAINGATRARHAARWPLGTIPIQVHMQPEKLLVQLLQRPNHLGTSTWTKWRRSSRPVWSLQE